MLCVYCYKIRYRLILLNVATSHCNTFVFSNFFLSNTLPTIHIQNMSEELGCTWIKMEPGCLWIKIEPGCLGITIERICILIKLQTCSTF